MTKVPTDFADKKICIIGLGYVGLTLAAVMAEAGFIVYGIEKDEEKLSMINKARAHFYEPRLNEILEKQLKRGNLLTNNTLPRDIDVSVFILTVGTPLDENGQVRLDMVDDAIEQISETNYKNKLIIMRSTLKLGTTSNISKRLNPNDLNICDIAFCPERTVEGQALKELRHLPQIVGGIDSKSSLRASIIFQFITSTIVKVSCPETAEMIKMIDNTQRDIIFGFSNEIAEVCDGVGVNALEVIQAGKLGYSRTNLPMPGPVGGPCLSKDPHILSQSVKDFDVDVKIALQARNTNENMPKNIISSLNKVFSNYSLNSDLINISLLGLAFKGKPATNDLRGSMLYPILEELKLNYPYAKFYGYDPLVEKQEIEKLGLLYQPTIEEAFSDKTIAIMLTNHYEFENLPITKLLLKMNSPSILYDLWSNYDPLELNLPKGYGYVSFGNLKNSIFP